VILYRKAPQLRIRRTPAPAPPFWCATTIAPYAARRATPVAIDYATLRATGADKLEVAVAENVRDELERTRGLDGPVLIEAAEAAEEVFRRGEEVLRFCSEQHLAALHLISTRGAWPLETPDDAVIVIAAWPLDLAALDRLFGEARDAKWGVAVPVMYPATTDLARLAELATLARERGTQFLAALPLEIDPTAKQALAAATNLDDDAYAMLFHSELDPLHLATERHIAALAAENGLADFVVPPRWNERSNWNASVLLTLTASRMLAMEDDVDLAANIARSARVACELDKPIARVAEAASLSIIEALDEVSVEMLTEWLETGRSGFAEMVAGKWRLRRDYGV
jgi:hypothetical protein